MKGLSLVLNLNMISPQYNIVSGYCPDRDSVPYPCCMHRGSLASALGPYNTVDPNSVWSYYTWKNFVVHLGGAAERNRIFDWKTRTPAETEQTYCKAGEFDSTPELRSSAQCTKLWHASLRNPFTKSFAVMHDVTGVRVEVRMRRTVIS